MENLKNNQQIIVLFTKEFISPNAWFLLGLIIKTFDIRSAALRTVRSVINKSSDEWNDKKEETRRDFMIPLVNN